MATSLLIHNHFSLKGPIDPHFSNIKIKISHKKNQVCFCQTISFNHALTIKKKHYNNLFTGLQKMEKARKWSQELLASSFVVPSFQRHLPLITILNYCLTNLLSETFICSRCYQTLFIYKVLYDNIIHLVLLYLCFLAIKYLIFFACCLEIHCILTFNAKFKFFIVLPVILKIKLVWPNNSISHIS